VNCDVFWWFLGFFVVFGGFWLVLGEFLVILGGSWRPWVVLSVSL
jgi:hypothetical protein